MHKQNMLAQLESNEAVLLMYLSGELTHQDRAEVEQMLQRDAGMRAELDRLRTLLASADVRLAEADKQEPLNVEAAIRNTTRAMRQWQAGEGVRPAAHVRPQTPQQTLVPWWCYPLAAAACVLLALAVWLAYTDPNSGNVPEPRVAQAPEWDDATGNDDLPSVKQARAFLAGDQIVAAFDPTDQVLSDAADKAPLDRIERRIQALQQLDGNLWD